MSIKVTKMAFIILFLFIYLGALGLSYSILHLHCVLQDLL